jgi:hypothetical protein
MAAGTGWEAHPGDGAGELVPLQQGRGNTGFGEGERWRAPRRERLGRAEREERRSPEREWRRWPMRETGGNRVDKVGSFLFDPFLYDI